MSALSLPAFDRYIQLSKTSSSMDESSERKPPFSLHPPLYVTPAPAVLPPRPPSPSPLSPSLSPYVVNFKRRGPAQSARVENENETYVVEQGGMTQTIVDQRRTAESGYTIVPDGSAVQVADNSTLVPKITNSRPKIVLGNGHLDHAHVNASAGHNSIARAEDMRFVSPRTSTISEEFFDAPDAPLDDSASEDEALCLNLSSSRVGRSPEKLTPQLQEEIARRIRAEESVALLQRRWEDMARRCSLYGQGMLEVGGGKEQDVLEQLSQEVVVTRLVGGAIARGAVRAEKDDELESMLAGKNREISRLWDKLQYVELVNREMSQRNQEAIERAKRRKRRRRNQRRWAVGCFCATFCVGTAGLICYKFFPWDRAQWWSKEPPKPLEPMTSKVLTA